MLLAPVMRERKGEHVQVFEQLRAQGFVRVRVDGVLHEIDAVPALALRQKHTIEAVIDRFKPRADIKQRLAESPSRPRCKLGDGMAIGAVDMDDAEAAPHAVLVEVQLPGLRLLAAGTGAAPVLVQLAGRRLPDLRRPGRDRSSSIPARVVVHPELSPGRRRGARLGPAQRLLLPADRRRWPSTTASTSTRLAASCRRTIRQAVLYGSGDELITFTYLTESGGRTPAQAQVRGHRAEPRAPLPRDRIAGGARGTGEVHQRAPLPRVRRRAPEPLRAQRVRRRARRCRRSRSCRSTRRWRSSSTLKLPGWRGEIAAKIVKEIRERLRFLVDVGLDYLTLERKADTLSGGEAQRIRLASQIGAGLVGVMYVLDEPSIGLHQRDNERLLGTLTRLRDLGNTVIVVEHDEDAIRLADHIVDIGPGAGVHGGEIVAQGSSTTS